MTITIFVTCSRYINASWILFKGYKQKFIASQVTRNLHLHLHYDLNLHLMLIPTKAPIEDTIGDFWHCVAYHKVRFHQTLSPRPIAPKAPKLFLYAPIAPKSQHIQIKIKIRIAQRPIAPKCLNEGIKFKF